MFIKFVLLSFNRAAFQFVAQVAVNKVIENNTRFTANQAKNWEASIKQIRNTLILRKFQKLNETDEELSDKQIEA